MRNPGTALLLEHQQRHRSFYYTTNANHNQQQRKVELPFGKNASRRRSIPTIMYIWIGLFLLAARTGWQKTALLVHGFQAAAVVVSSNSRNLHSNNKNLVLASFFWPGGASARTAEPTKTRGGSFAKATNDDDDDDNEFSTSSTAAAATLRSVTFCNLPKDQEPNVLCDFLLEVGACAASLTDADRGTNREQAVFSEPIASLDTKNYNTLQWDTPVWNRCNVTAFFSASIDIPATMTLVQETFPEFAFFVSSYTVASVPNQDWVVTVQKSWKPIVKAHKFVFCFPWHSQKDIQEAIVEHEKNNKQGDNVGSGTSDQKFIPLQLQGGIAFGTGEHPTTELCLEWLASSLARTMADRGDDIAVLDYGSGSGILGMAACALAPERISAVGIDIDIDACLIANTNAAINNLPMRSYLPPLLVSQTSTTESTDSPDSGSSRSSTEGVSQSFLLKSHQCATKQKIDPVDGTVGQRILDVTILEPDASARQFDVCVANIMAAPLATLAPTLFQMIKPNAQIGLSGILPYQGDLVVEAYKSAGFINVCIAKELGGWLLVTAQRPSSLE